MIHRISAIAVLIAALGLAAACSSQPSTSETADLVFKNAKVVTVDAANPQVQAVAVRGSRILAVGTDDQIQDYVGPSTQVIDLDGQLVIPGFIESHGHFMGLGEAKMELDLTTAHTWNDIVQMVAAAAEKAPPGAWILGRGWHQDKWQQEPTPNVEGLPTNEGLSKVSPNNPVMLTHASGHAVFVNKKALELAAISRKTPDPPGGQIVRDSRGNPIGMLRDRASAPVRKALSEDLAQRTPEQVEADLRERVRLAGQEALSKGVTTFQDQGESFKTIDFLKKLADEGKLPLRLYVLVNGESVDSLAEHLPEYRMIGYGKDFLSVRAIGEVTSDGALGTHSAWLLKPYSDLPGSTGVNVTAMDTIRKIAELAVADDFQLAVHAIGDRANREVLDLYQQIFKEHPDKKDLRWRIEHAQHLSLQDIPRFAQLGVIASMQGIHATSDGPYVIKRLGQERARDGAYVWQSLMKTGALIANGTDVPVEDISPIQSFYASVTRRMNNGQQFFPDQCMTREQALRSYTINGAFAAFQEQEKGSITPGKLADMVVLSKDIMTVSEEEIPQAKVLYTILGGKIVYHPNDGQ